MILSIIRRYSVVVIAGIAVGVWLLRGNFSLLFSSHSSLFDLITFLAIGFPYFVVLFFSRQVVSRQETSKELFFFQEASRWVAGLFFVQLLSVGLMHFQIFSEEGTAEALLMFLLMMGVPWTQIALLAYGAARSFKVLRFSSR